MSTSMFSFTGQRYQTREVMVYQRKLNPYNLKEVGNLTGEGTCKFPLHEVHYGAKVHIDIMKVYLDTLQQHY